MATIEHQGGVVLDERQSMTMKVTKHGVATPTPDNADFIGVHIAKEECHGAAITEGTCGDVVGVNTTVTGDGECDSTQ